MNSVIKFFTALFFACLLLSHISMLGFFIGYENFMLESLIQIQGSLNWLLLIFCVLGLGFFIRTYGWHKGLLALWLRTPGWIVFSVILTNTLVFSGWLSFYLVQKKLGIEPEAKGFIPLYSALLSSLAFVISYGCIKLDKLPSTYAERNQDRGAIPPSWDELWNKLK